MDKSQTVASYVYMLVRATIVLEGSRRASRNGPVSDPPPESRTLRFATFASEQEATGEDGAPLSSRPYLLFLPGIDGTGMNALSQFALLAPNFELVALNIPNTDRTPFAELVEQV
jgi:hypothetical protein